MVNVSTIKVAILGFGTVGEGVYKTIQSHQEKLKGVLGKSVEVAAVLVKNKHKKRDINEGILVTEDFEEILNLKELDVVVEAIVGENPAFSYLEKAIQKGCHIITANKEMFALHGTTLQKLADEHQVSVGFEATVAGGVPVIQTVQQLLNINQIIKMEGILNGTSNYILTEMRANQVSFSEALEAAQVKGYAEADPTNDVEGYDAFYKLMILSEIAFGEKPDWSNVPREGITEITPEQIKEAEKLGLRFKLIASIEQSQGEIKGYVRPTLVSESHPLYHIEGVENSVSIEADIVGRITLQGPGAGMLPTTSAVIEDLIHVVLGNGQQAIFSGVPSGLLKQDEKQQQKWLIMNKNGVLLTSSSSAQKESHVLVKADEPTIHTLRDDNKQASFFQVLGEMKSNLFVRNDSA